MNRLPLRLQVFLLAILIKMCLCANRNINMCKTKDFTSFYVTVCGKNNFRKVSNSLNQTVNIVCKTKSPDFQGLKYLNLSSATKLKIKDCSLKLDLVKLGSFPSLEHFSSSSGGNGDILKNASFKEMCTLRIIILNNNNIKIIEPSAFSCLKNILMLDLAGNRLEELPENVFDEMNNLLELNLNDNDLKVISKRTFSNLLKLKTLYIQSNNLISLPDGLFDNLSRLEILSLSKNNIEHLSQNLLSNLTELKQFDLSSNVLKNLTCIFTNNGKLLILDLQRNGGLELHENSLCGLIQLQKLYLNECNLTSLPMALFKDTRHLSEIRMYNNRLTIIPKKVFGEMTNLTFLDLSFNDITNIEDEAFINSRNLEAILMFKNNLPVVTEYYFQGLSSLKLLDISSNFINCVDINAFSNLPNLFCLNISHNYISSFDGPSPFGRSDKLSIIDASYNRLQNIRNINLGQLFSLEEFYVTNNEIEEFDVPNFITTSVKIHLDWNNVKRIHSSRFRNTNFRNSASKIQIYFTGNPFVCDCYAFDLYNYLNSKLPPEIEFPDGLICQYPNHLKEMKLNSLMKTDFICNITKDCPENCSCIHRVSDNVNILNCTDAGLEDLPTKVPDNTNILYINYNNLKSLVGLNESLWKNLTELYADHNDISTNIFTLPKNLERLTLHQNRMKALPSAIKKQIAETKDFRVNVSNNLWPCECSMLPTKKYMSDNINHFGDIADVHCIFSNKSSSTASLIRMNENDLCPSFEYLQYIISFVLMTFLILTLIFYYRHKIYVLSILYTHCRGCYLLFLCHKPIPENKLYDCFIAYSSTDREVMMAILEELENKPPHYKFCIHERNWLPGQYITNNIIESVQNSRKTLVILSEAFLKSPWFHFEFQAAYFQTIQDKTDRLVVILKGDLPREEELDKDVLHVLSLKTYLRWGEMWFWEKLRYALHQQNVFPERKGRFTFDRVAYWFVKKNIPNQDIVLNEEL